MNIEFLISSYCNCNNKYKFCRSKGYYLMYRITYLGGWVKSIWLEPTIIMTDSMLKMRLGLAKLINRLDLEKPDNDFDWYHIYWTTFNDNFLDTHSVNLAMEESDEPQFHGKLIVKQNDFLIKEVN